MTITCNPRASPGQSWRGCPWPWTPALIQRTQCCRQSGWSPPAQPEPRAREKASDSTCFSPGKAGGRGGTQGEEKKSLMPPWQVDPRCLDTCLLDSNVSLRPVATSRSRGWAAASSGGRQPFLGGGAGLQLLQGGSRPGGFTLDAAVGRSLS